LVPALVDGEEQVALLEVGAVLEVDFDDSPADLRLDVHGFDRRRAADFAQVDGHIPRRRRHDGDRRRGALHRPGLLPLGAARGLAPLERGAD
jgi:hypothetical protein